jgi:hypothetical protein
VVSFQDAISPGGFLQVKPEAGAGGTNSMFQVHQVVKSVSVAAESTLCIGKKVSDRTQRRFWFTICSMVLHRQLERLIGL